MHEEGVVCSCTNDAHFDLELGVPAKKHVLHIDLEHGDKRRV